MAEGNKNWDRPWSMDEMIENAENWSLAGDVALLNTIKAFADNMLTKTLTISDNVDYLLNDLDEVGLKLEISHNEFQSLRNTQFIESRVYEDDETLDVKVEPKEEQATLTEDNKVDMIREAVLEGLKVMDKYFDKIEVSISDSEEESEKSYVLQAKDLYSDRPLPLLIGTEDWYKKWHAGLAETSSEEESDQESETYSDSDSDDHLPKDLLTKGSETSSELDFTRQAGDNRPVANSTFNDSAKQPDIFESDDTEEGESLPVKAPISNKNFAEQLAEKLGNVISEREDIPADINKRPIQPAKSNQFAGNIFSDEPPPLDDLDDTILPKSAQSGLFSGGQGLFDDNEDELFWGQQNKAVKTEPAKVKTENKPDAPADALKTTSLPKSSQVSKGLFDSDNSSDDDLFASNRKRTVKPPFLQPFKAAAPLFDEEPPELEPKKETVVKTTPKVADKSQIEAFGNTSPEKKPEQQKSEKTPKKISLFDDDDDLFRDDLFSTPISKKPASSLFEDDENKIHTKIENLDGNKDRKGAKKPKKVVSLFSDTEEEDNEEKNQPGVPKIIEKEDKINNDDTPNAEFGGKEGASSKISESNPGYKEDGADLSERQVIGAEKKVPGGLFDEEEDAEVESGPPELRVTEPTPQARRMEGISLFGSTPPPDDDDWDVKSDNFSDNEDLFSYRAEGNTVASSLFDNEPPSLGPNDSSGIVRDQNVTRVDTDDSSFYPYASSSRRLSSDIFSEQQSQDSLFVTKSKTESTSVPPPSLDIIPEYTKISHVEITPSGHPSDLEDTTDVSGKSLTADSVFEEEEPEKSKRTVSLFDEDDDSEGLFQTKPENLPKLSEKRQSLFGEDPKASNSGKADPKSPPETGRIANLINQIQSEPVKEQLPVVNTGSPGKLKHNLNINVNALLPGAGPKLRDIPKSQSLDLPKEDTPSDVSTPDGAYFTPEAPIEPKWRKDVGLEKAVSFEDALDHVEVLRSVTKDRAKIPIKRRPSTRRGRREAIVRSEADLSTGFEEAGGIGGEVEKSPAGGYSGIPELPKKEEFHEPAAEIQVSHQENPSSRKTQPVRNIFGGNGDSDDELFPNRGTTTTKITKSKPKATIFDSEDSDSDLFGASGTKKPRKGNSDGKIKSENVATGKKSLFDDSSSDEDLFATKGNVRSRVAPKQAIGKKTQPSTLRKLENIETDDDPLSSLLK